MLPGPRTLHIVSSWSSQGEIVLASWADAHRLSREGWESLPREHALGFFDRVDHLMALPLRQFIAVNRLARRDLRDLGDHDILDLVHACIRGGEVVAIRPGRLITPSDAQELRRLAAQIERQVRGRLSYRGRQYKLTLGDDLARIPDRNSYEVVPQAEAHVLLDQMSRDMTTLGDLLAKAKEKLSKDWRPPLSQPDGLVLLRRRPVMASKPKNDGPAITPSMMKGMLEKVDPVIEGTLVELDLSEVELPTDSDAAETSEAGGGEDSGTSDDTDQVAPKNGNDAA